MTAFETVVGLYGDALPAPNPLVEAKLRLALKELDRNLDRLTGHLQSGKSLIELESNGAATVLTEALALSDLNGSGLSETAKLRVREAIAALSGTPKQWAAARVALQSALDDLLGVQKIWSGSAVEWLLANNELLAQMRRNIAEQGWGGPS